MPAALAFALFSLEGAEQQSRFFRRVKISESYPHIALSDVQLYMVDYIHMHLE
jgi:hypothetical protein